MEKKIFAVLILLILIPLISAEPNLKIKKMPIKDLLITKLNEPAIFDLEINNLGKKEIFQIYSIVGVSITPTDFFELPEGITKLRITALPNKRLQNKSGPLKFEYQIKGKTSGFFKDTLTINLIDLSEAIEITSEDFNIEDNEIKFNINNKERRSFNNLTINLESTFFSDKEIISLGPLEGTTFSVPLTSKETKKISAGSYIIDITLNLKNISSKKQNIITYLEKENLLTNYSKKGTIIRTTEISKINEGNTRANAKIEVNKNIISRFFTINSPDPDNIEREGINIKYVWNQALNPGQTFSVKSTTNYTIPFILLILIASIAIMAKKYFTTMIVIKKRVSFVKTKSGKFALKVTLNLKARSNLSKIQIIERLPANVKLYERFGKVPDKIDKDSRRLIWNIPHLRSGEEKVYSYIIYSKLNIIGRFELPQGLAIFEANGLTQEVLSNRAFFMVEKTYGK